MSDYPVSLRNISTEITQVAQALSRRNGLSVADILRLALMSGMLVEATKAGPDRAGTYGGLDVEYLARALRRHLGAAIDLLLEQGQHPYQGAFLPGNGSAPPASSGSSPLASGDTMLFDRAMADELESLGVGVGLSQGMFGEELVAQ